MFRTPFDLQEDGWITLVFRPRSPVNIRHDRFSLRDRPRFIQHDRVHPVHQLQALGILDQYIMFRPFTDPDHDRCRRRQSQRTRAGNNQHRDRRQQSMSESKVTAYQHPHDKRDHRNPHHYRNKDSGNTVHQFLHGSFTSLCLLHHPDNIGQNGFSPDLIGTETETSLLIYCPGIHGLSFHLLHGYRLPGNHTLIDKRRPFCHFSIHRNLFPRFHDQNIPYRNLTDRHLLFATVGKNFSHRFGL